MGNNLAPEEKEYYSSQKRLWDIVAPFYDVLVAPASKVRDGVAAYSGAGEGSMVLDVATGTGKQAAAFARRGCRVTGVDLSQAMLMVAVRKNRHPNLGFGLADGTSLPFADGTFDVVCVSFALHEMPLTIMEMVIAEMARVAKSQGTVVIVDYGLPRNRVWKYLLYRFIKLFEGKTYSAFMGTDLKELLGRWHVAVTGEARAALGVAMILKGRKQG